jgi:predicted Zn-dependent protease
VVCGLVLCLVAAGCAITPQQELQIGDQNHGAIEKESGGLYPDPAVQQYVNSVGMKLAPLANRPDMHWQYGVVNSDEINAFAIPGGYIYITKGLLFRMHNEAELAGVLGHETAHIAHRDSAQQIERSQGLGVLTTGIGIFGGSTAGELSQVASQLATLQYSRDQEKSADMTGLQYMAQAGYNPQGMVQAMQTIKNTSKGSPPQFLSNHPDPGNRIEYLTQAINQSYAGAAQSGDYGGDRFREGVLSRETNAAVPAAAKQR